MKGMTDVFVTSAVAVVVTVSSVVAEEYYFQKYQGSTSVICSDHVTSQGVSPTQYHCAFNCARSGQCRGFVFSSDTMGCTEIHINNFPDRPCQAGSGNFYAKQVPVCNEDLVTGPEGVDDDQLSESSYWCQAASVEQQEYLCSPAEDRHYSAWYARLGSVGQHTGAWTAGSRDVNQYVQVDFKQPRIVSGIVLTGRDPVVDEQYVTSFRVLYSDDCSLFEEYSFENGTLVTLDGNSDGYEVITRHLPDRIEARCFRVNPRDWHGADLSMRFDLKGCP